MALNGKVARLPISPMGIGSGGGHDIKNLVILGFVFFFLVFFLCVFGVGGQNSKVCAPLYLRRSLN